MPSRYTEQTKGGVMEDYKANITGAEKIACTIELAFCRALVNEETHKKIVELIINAIPAIEHKGKSKWVTGLRDKGAYTWAVYICPHCKEEFKEGIEIEKFKYCPACGGTVDL